MDKVLMAVHPAHSTAFVLGIVGIFLALFTFPYTSVAATTYGHSTYGSGLYGGLEAPDTTPPEISSISSGTPGQTSVTIMWTTDEAATSTVSYGLTTSYGSASSSASLATSHSITISGLSAATLYHYRVASEDAAGNVATSSDQTFTTASVPDTTAPLISSISSGTPGVSSATVTWITDEAANSQLAYGTSASYGATTTLDATLVTSHSVELTGLAAATLYHFRIRTADNAGNARYSSDQTFTTSATSDVTIPSVSLTAPSDGATVSGNVAVTATASDNIGLAGVSFYADGVRIGSEDTTSTYEVTLDSTMLSNGAHTLLAAARDTSNNYATSSAVTITVSNSRGGGSRHNNTDTPSSESSLSTAITNLVLDNRALFLAALDQGITLPLFIRETLGLSETPAPSPSVRDLTISSTGEDVRALQVYLNTHGYTVATSGPGSVGNETNFFGPATQAALIRFQTVSGITPAAGYYGPKTRAYIATH